MDHDSSMCYNMPSQDLPSSLKISIEDIEKGDKFPIVSFLITLNPPSLQQAV